MEEQDKVRILTIPPREMYEYKTKFYFPFGKKIREKGNIEEEISKKLQEQYGIKPEQINLNSGSFMANQNNPEITDFIGFSLSFASQKDMDKMKSELMGSPCFLENSVRLHTYRLVYITLLEYVKQ